MANGARNTITTLRTKVKTLVNKNATGAVLSQFNYTYYLDANEATKTDAQGQTTYEYDGLGRLENTQEPGNVTRIYAYDDRNNRSGIVTNGLLNENPIDMSFEYDGLNRLTKATGLQTSTYKYNADGLRQSKTVDGVKTTHLLDGVDVVADITGTNKTKYVRGINLICMEKSGQRYYYLFDAHGNVVQMVDANGNVVNNYTYDEWGNIKSQTEDVENPFRYCGEYFDKETGVIYLRARYYDPTIGRFISEDSYWGKDNDPLSLNLYTYCSNNPTMFIDPTGHAEVMLRYIAEKNGAKIKVVQKSFLWIKYGLYNVEVTIGDETVSYDGKIVNERMFVDSNQFGKDFGITDKKLLTHQEGDQFYSADDAAIAFGLIINPQSMIDNLEYGANIYESDGKYSYRDVVRGTPAGVSIASVNNDYGKRVGTIHTHAAYLRNCDNDNFSPGDKKNAEKRGVNNYVVTPGGYLKRYGIRNNKVKTITDAMPFDPLHPNFKK